MSKVITPRDQDYSKWYQDIVKRAGLADNSAVRGCMVIKPLGYAIWENLRDELDRRFKETGHVNAYFPIFIPKSFLSKEAQHVEGFAKECAVVTHHRLMNDPDGNGVVVDPSAKLEEELIVRPTSETIIWNTYKDWIQSYRDLPLLINQWANVVRWEMRTRPFLRTAEFLWQEGHTAHATSDEAEKEAKMIHGLYAQFCEEMMAMPVIKGVKTANERFAGAIDTYTIEALMQDGKALQAGTSHFLGQNFAKAFEVKFLSNENKEEWVWATSWGVTTRLVGAMVMVHSDDQGLVIPPRVAPTQVVIVPIPKPGEEIDRVAGDIMTRMKEVGVRVKYDNDDTKRPGFKFADHEMRGTPIRLGIGKRDLEKGVIEVARRDTKSKESVPMDQIIDHVQRLLEEIQSNMLDKAKRMMEEHITQVDTYEEMKDVLENKGGFVRARWDGTTATELKIKEETKATIRCLELDRPDIDGGQCVYSGEPAQEWALFAKAY